MSTFPSSRILIACCVAVLGLFGATVAHAEEFGIAPEGFTAAFSTLQAGGHPDLTTSITFARHADEALEGSPQVLVGAPRDIDVELPAGLVGNPDSAPLCDMRRVENNTCPQSSAVGVAKAALELAPGFYPPTTSLIYNIAPYDNEPAAFAFIALGFPVRLDTALRESGSIPGRYAVSVNVAQIAEQAPVEKTTLTFWGVSADHNGTGALGEPGVEEYNDGAEGGEGRYGVPGPGAKLPFLANPSSCEGEAAGEGPLTFGIQTDSWQDPGVEASAVAQSTLASEVTPGGIAGCSALTFKPSITVEPEALTAGAPTGYKVELRVPQNENPDALATPDLKDAVVTLPAGTVLSPSAANGLRGCADTGAEGIELDSEAPGHCPEASAIGSVEVNSPLLASPLTGQVFQGEPECSPCSAQDAEAGKMIRLFVQAQGSGVVVKLAGRVSVNQQTGQLTATFDENPQLPFSDFILKFKGGSGAPLVNPSTCGPARTTSRLTPWSSAIAVEPSSEFEVNGCAPQGFTPGFVAGTTNNQAGAYSPFSVALSRQDSEQNFSGLQMTLPAGLLAKLAGVPRCGATEAAAGTCPEAARIGTVTATAGPGPAPIVTTGRVFLTGPYSGGPFGEVVEVPAVAGPFNLGTVVVRGSIRISPVTAQATVVSDPFPTVLDGVPLQLKTVNVTLDRPGFTLNPTSCNELAVAGTLSSAQDGSSAVSSRFQAADCANLAFKPGFSASTQGQTSKANGASLTVRVAPGPGQANIAKVSLQLPKQFPSRLTTLQKACTEAQFNANPAGCPEGSNIGTARAITPILGSPLVGPAYLVSRGGAAFPDVEFILQGEGVTIDLDGKTQIKNGITYSHFETVPDAPISSFETVLPEGPHSVLATNLPASAHRSLCGIALNMPTTITGQNGAVVKQTTKIAVQGCAKVAALTRSEKLTKALKSCRADHKHSKKSRASCEQTARRRYAPPAKKSAKKSAHKSR